MSDEFLVAAREGNLQFLESFIAGGGDVNFENDEGYCALSYAIIEKHLPCVEYLLSLPSIKTNIEIQEPEYDDDISGIPLHLAAYYGNLAAIYQIVKKSPADINWGANEGYTPLQAAVIGEQLEAFKLLLRLGANDEIETDEDKQDFGFLEGMNTLQLIAHYAAGDKSSQNYQQMWQILIRKKLKNKESLTGNIIDDSDDSCSETYDREERYNELFAGIEEKHVRDAMVRYYTEDCDDLEPDEEGIHKIIHRSKREDFGETYQYELRRSLKEEDEGEVFSDTDSETDPDYSTEQIDSVANALSLKSYPPSTKLVLHARGHHFYKRRNAHNQTTGTSAEIKNHRHYSRNNQLAAWSIYSTDTYQRAGMKFSLPLSHEQSQHLNNAANDTKNVLGSFHSEKNVSPVLQRGTAMSRTRFESRLIELVQRYVNSYRTLTEDIKKAQQSTSVQRKNDRTQQKQEYLQQLRANPFVSTSEDIEAGLNYAFATINYDKKDTHQPHMDIVLTPEYQIDGDLKHPYIGVIFITLHTEKDLNDNSLNIAELFRNDKIDPLKGPGTHESSGYVRALERIFMGEINQRHICLAKVVRLPNFYYPYRPFVLEKYGLDKKTYDKFKRNLAIYGEVHQGTMKNKQAFYRTQQSIIDHVIAFQRRHLIEEITRWAKSNNLIIGSLDDQGTFTANIDINPNDKIAACSRARRQKQHSQVEDDAPAASHTSKRTKLT